MKLLAYDTLNLGDDIQTLAARQFTSHPDGYINRERLKEYDGPPCKLIGNGWYCHQPHRAWPPAPQIDFLPISMHFDQGCHEALKKPDSLKWLQEHQPIGCRDLYTLDFLESLGIKAYFSGCLTLTFPRYEGPRSGIYAVDVEAEGIPLTHHTKLMDVEQRMTEAQRLLDIYKTAERVVTSRLHCALPCVAFGTPVKLTLESERLKGLEGYLKGQMAFPEAMAAKCREFMSDT